ncbi:MAG: hypothetical protein Q9165_007946 [Trypethelium subeluteriae]
MAGYRSSSRQGSMAGGHNQMSWDATAKSRTAEDFRKESPRLKYILESIGCADEFDKFRAAGVSDFLLPFPKDGRGLPAYFRNHGDKRSRFLERQHSTLSKLEDLEDALKEGSAAHHHIEEAILPENFLSASNDTARDIVPCSSTSLATRQLGQGGYARVFAARFKASEESLAWKKIPRPGTNGQDWSSIDHVSDQHRYPDSHQAMFEQELCILRRIRDKELFDHRLRSIRDAHIIRLRSSLTHPHAFYLLLSPLALCNLDELLTEYTQGQLCNGKFSIGGHDIQKKLIHGWLHDSFGCLSAGVLFLHRCEIRHKDIKPKNVLILPGGRICLCDFATAHDASAEGNADTHGRPMIHTPDYQSPEKLAHGRRSFSEDVFFLGLIFLEILTAIKGKTMNDLVQSLCDQEVETDPDAVPILRHSCSRKRLEFWLDNLNAEPDASDAAKAWIKNLVS